MSRADQLERLERLVAAEIAAYGALLAASRAHQAALLGDERQGMSASLQAQVAAMERCRAASEARVAVGDALAAELGLTTPCPIGRLLAALPGEPRGLHESRARLLELTQELRALNGGNRRLSEHRLDLLQGDFRAFHDIVAAASGRSEEQGHPVEGSLLSLKA